MKYKKLQDVSSNRVFLTLWMSLSAMLISLCTMMICFSEKIFITIFKPLVVYFGLRTAVVIESVFLLFVAFLLTKMLHKKLVDGSR